jgi:vacuolar-type H+-ATPase subunit E/Vma4
MKAAPHITNFISEAQPHVKRAASKAVESAIDSVVQHVTEKIKSVQTGNGIKGRRRIKKVTIAKTQAL